MAATLDPRRKALAQLSALDIAQQREANEAPPLPTLADDISSNWTPPVRRMEPGPMPTHPATEIAIMRAQTGGATGMRPDDSAMGFSAPGGAHARNVADSVAMREQMALADRLDGERAVRELDQEDYLRRDAQAAQREDGERIIANLDARKDPARRTFKGVSPEDIAELEAQQERFQQGLRLSGQTPAKPASGGVRRPQVSVATVGPAGPVPQARPIAAPTAAAEGTSTAMQSVGRDTSSKPPGDVDFAAAQDAADERRLAAALGRAGAQVNRALSGVGFDEGAYNDMEQNADSPVRRLLAQREADRKKALEDPTSDASKRVQAAVAKSMPGVYSPDELARITAADADMVTKYGAMRQRLEERKADVAREDVLRAAQQTREDTIRKDERRFQAQQAGAGRAFQAAQADKAFARQKELANLNNAADLAQVQARGGSEHAAKLAERNVGGFTFDPANPPSVDAAKNMAEAVTARDEILGSLDRLETLFKDSGTETGGGATQSEMESEQMNITNKLRVLNKMGVPNAADYEMLAKQIPTITGTGALFTRNSSIAPKFAALRQQIARTVDATARAYKFSPAGGQPQASASQRRTVNGKTYVLENGTWYEEG